MFLLEFMLGDEIMSENYQVGEFYNAKTFKESGFNFPDGKYKLKIIREGLEGSDQYKTDLDGNWYYFEFPINDEGIDYMWVPESVVVEVFE
jgi:hypothetical protein